MNNLKYILIIFAIIIFSSCQKEWKDPNEVLPSAQADITSILVSPNVYDSAGVIVRGMVWNKETVEPAPVKNEKGEMTQPEPYTYFKLSDRNGNYLGVTTNSENNSFQDGDIVEVLGIYRRNYATEQRHFKNEIQAKKITVIKSLREKYENKEKNK